MSGDIECMAIGASIEDHLIPQRQFQVNDDPPWFISDLFYTGPDELSKLDPALAKLKNTVIGSNRQKSYALRHGALPQILNLMSDVNLPDSIRQNACIILGSLVKGTPENVKTIVAANSIPKLIAVLESSDEKLIEFALGCLTTIFSYDFAPSEILFNTPGLISHLLVLLNESVNNQAAIATILSHSCKNRNQQDSLCELNVIQNLASLLFCSNFKVQMPTVRCLTSLAHKNEQVASTIVYTSYESITIPDQLVRLLTRDAPLELQLGIATCLSYLYRSKALTSEDPKIMMKALPTLVRLCGREHSNCVRAGAADALAYLIEMDKELQAIAAVSNHLIPTLSEFLFKPSTLLKSMNDENLPMIQAAFKAFGCLGANDETIRKRIIERDHLMECLVFCMEEPDEMVSLSAVRCLHSLSRSVHLLRTTFKDHTVWKPLMKLLQHENQEILNVASSTVCNLILEFSPAKEHILSEGAISKFCELTKHSDSRLRINGIWALMNVAFQADEAVKTEILKSLRDIGTDHIFRLLSDPEVMVVMKTLGLLRNLLSTPSHIDHIMDFYGNEIMQATILTLESEHGPDVKEQALCMLGNIADGSRAKEFIMMNEDILKKITNYLSGNGNPKLQTAAVVCVSNLAWKEEAGSSERQAKLKEMGVKDLLHQLITIGDQALFDRVKTALNQFAPN